MSCILEVIQGDITETDTEAIVNAANNNFWMGSGVAGAIKAKGGDIIEREATAKGPVMPGEAIFTGAGQLPCKYVIHGAVMGQDLHTNNILIRQTTIACLNIAEKLKVESVAFPAFGTGVGRFPIRPCSNIMVEAARLWRSQAQYVKRIQFCMFDDVGLGLFKKAVREKLAGE